MGALLRGCSVIREIVRRAAETGHLRHTHQLILLYTAGHLGEEGARFIHETILLCRNYDPAICQKYIDRLDAKHPPISCRRIREWLEEEGETGWCTCPTDRRSPLKLVQLVSAQQARAEIDGKVNREITMEKSSEIESSEVEPAEPESRKQKRKARPEPVSYLAGVQWEEVVSDLFNERNERNERHERNEREVAQGSEREPKRESVREAEREAEREQEGDEK